MQYPLQGDDSKSQGAPTTESSTEIDAVPTSDSQADSQADDSQGATPELELELELEVDEEAEDASADTGAGAEIEAQALPHESLPHDSLPYESLPYESLPYESLPYESLPWESAARDENEPEVVVSPLEFEPNWNVLNAATAKRPRQETSFLRKVLPPVLGGLAALPIATAIMWYGFGRDIGTTGHYVSQYVPWIVPQKLRANRWETWDEPMAQKQPAKPRSNREAFPSLNRNEVTSRPPVVAERPGVASEDNENNNNNDANAAVSSTDLPSLPSLPSSNKMDKLESSNKSDNTNSESPRTVQSLESIASGISESIRMLRMLQNELYEAPKDKKIAMIGDYYRTAKKLSEQSASLRGRSASIWRKELENIAREILKDKNSKTVMQYGPIGKLPGISASLENDFLVTVLNIGERDEPDSNNLWTLNEPWLLGEQKVSVQMLPGAWRLGSATVPTTCLVFGRLIATGSSNAESSTMERGTLTLQVHAALPE
ncbi:MAG: hypothetical protein NTU79_01605 [Planctomycetota bacterium]|nr:hypothetical protein [Planctomycetota bacterium]